MSDKRFNIVFQGELIGGADLAAVKQNLAKVFKMDAAKVEALFSGKKVVLKKNADQATAMKFRAVLKQAGARCEMVEVGAESSGAEPVAPQPAETAKPSQVEQTEQASETAQPASESAVSATTESASQSTPSSGTGGTGAIAGGSLETVGTIRTGGEGFSDEFDVAAVGSDIADKQDEAEAPDVDLSQFSLAPPGSDLEQLPDERKTEVPDISHLSLDKAE